MNKESHEIRHEILKLLFEQYKKNYTPNALQSDLILSTEDLAKSIGVGEEETDLQLEYLSNTEEIEEVNEDGTLGTWLIRREGILAYLENYHIEQETIRSLEKKNLELQNKQLRFHLLNVLIGALIGILASLTTTWMLQKAEEEMAEIATRRIP